MNHPLDRLSDSLQRAVAALGCAVKSIADFISAMMEYTVTICPPELLEATRQQQAIKEAPPKVRHLALRGKKRRTRKKNVHRAMREYQRRSRHDDNR